MVSFSSTWPYIIIHTSHNTRMIHTQQKPAFYFTSLCASSSKYKIHNNTSVYRGMYLNICKCILRIFFFVSYFVLVSISFSSTKVFRKWTGEWSVCGDLWNVTDVFCCRTKLWKVLFCILCILLRKIMQVQLSSRVFYVWN